MYGTIARIKATPATLEAIRKFEQRTPPGFVRLFLYRMDADPNEMMLVVLFESKEAYLANASSPQQNQVYLALRKTLRADPEWHDGEVIYDYHNAVSPV